MLVLTVNAVELLRTPGARRHIDAAIPVSELDIHDPRVDGDVAVDVTLESTLDDIVVTGTLRVRWSDSCRRCLRPLHDTLTVEVCERYADDDPTGRRAVDPEAFPIDNGQIDLVPMVREEVLLGIPDAPLCRADCPGLCPICGADAGECNCDTTIRDDRWAVLDQLREL
jgi:DUF177 domain-containing protein